MKKINDIIACKALFFIMAFSIGLWTIRIPTIRDQIQTDYLGIGYIMATFAIGSIIMMLCANYFISKSSSKKIKINLDISESLMINKSGYLYVKDNLEINIKQVSWIVPIL